MRRLLVIAALALAVGAGNASAYHGEPRAPVDPRYTMDYRMWLDTAADRVPQPASLHFLEKPANPGPCVSWAYIWACTDSWGRIWVNPWLDYAKTRSVTQHEIGHNVDEQHLHDGHRDWFRREFGTYNKEAWAEHYMRCALNGPPMAGYGETEAQRDFICGWMRVLPVGVNYFYGGTVQR